MEQNKRALRLRGRIKSGKAGQRDICQGIGGGQMGNKTRAWCGYWDKALKDVYEYEQEQCWKDSWDCRKCPYFGEKGVQNDADTEG